MLRRTTIIKCFFSGPISTVHTCTLKLSERNTTGAKFTTRSSSLSALSRTTGATSCVFLFSTAFQQEYLWNDLTVSVSNINLKQHLLRFLESDLVNTCISVYLIFFVPIAQTLLLRLLFLTNKIRLIILSFCGLSI